MFGVPLNTSQALCLVCMKVQSNQKLEKRVSMLIVLRGGMSVSKVGHQHVTKCGGGELVTIAGSASSTPGPWAYLGCYPTSCLPVKPPRIVPGPSGSCSTPVSSPSHAYFSVSTTDSVNYTQSLCPPVETPLTILPV